ncbi:myosin-6-like [Palaemon carinicauda]|uniref:myosin-6-like n=1 Tax=Palaemon carinicauda TaxID=392227 RepID=UPI0035B5C240
MFTNNALRAISEYGKYILGGSLFRRRVSGPAAPVVGTGRTTPHFGRWSSGEEILGQGGREDVEVQVKAEQLNSNKDVDVQVKIEQLIFNRDVEVQVKTEQLLSNRDVEVQVETEPVSIRDVTVQTDRDTKIEDLRRKNENMAMELANKQAVIEAHENQLADYYRSILELKAELKMAQEKNDAHIQMQSGLMGEKEALKRELEGKVTLVEENTMKMVLLNKELEKAKKEIEAHD